MFVVAVESPAVIPVVIVPGVACASWAIKLGNPPSSKAVKTKNEILEKGIKRAKDNQRRTLLARDL